MPLSHFVDDRSDAATARSGLHAMAAYTRMSENWRSWSARSGTSSTDLDVEISRFTAVVDAGVLSLPPGQRPLSTWILVREKTDGTLKSRLMRQGCYQKHGVDYDDEDVCAPVADRISLCVVLAVAVAMTMYIETVDIATAFLNG